jgi:hypothetical protein
MPVDNKLANHLFRANGVCDDCPSCGKKEWRFGNDVVSFPYVNECSDEKPMPSLHAIPTICNNCGHIRFFFDKED